MISYINGDATLPRGKGKKIIAHICNDLGKWGKGFVMAVSDRWPSTRSEYLKWHRGRAQNNFALGAVQFIEVDPFIVVANMIGQRGIKTGSNGPPIRYDAVKDCLELLALKAKEVHASVHMPRIGCGLAGGKWEKIEILIKNELTTRGIEVTIYDHE